LCRTYTVVADAVSNARSLYRVAICLDGPTFLGDPLGQATLVNALREHKCLQMLVWAEFGSGPEAALQVTARDPLLRVLPACPHLRCVTILTKYASTDAMRYLLQLKPTTELRFLVELDQWLAVADEIRRGRCNVERLTLTILQVTRSEATEAVKAVASAIQIDRNLDFFIYNFRTVLRTKWAWPGRGLDDQQKSPYAPSVC
jgi:hypothetical protein